MAFLALEDMFGERMSVSALRVLSQVEGGLSGSEVARRLDAQQSTVRKALERLAARGIVIRENVGRTAAYRLDARREAVREIILPAFQAEAELRVKLWADIVTMAGRLRPRPVALVLYGSLARAARTPRDIDLLVVTHGEAEAERLRDELADVGVDFETRYLLPLSPVFLPRTQLEQGVQEKLLQSVLQDGILLYGEPVGRLRRMRRWHRTPSVTPA